MRLVLPNATSDAVYTHHFHLEKIQELAGYVIVRIDGLEAANGLTFDADQSRLHGIPQLGTRAPTELIFKAILQARKPAPPEQAVADLVLFVNPHPRSLWKQIEPDAALPYRKAHQQHQVLACGALHVIAASVRGRSHANSGTFREDDFELAHDADGTWLAVAVSDGAGSAQLSRLGSRLAVSHMTAALLDAMNKAEAEVGPRLPADRAPSEEEMDQLRRALLEPVGRAAFTTARHLAIEARALQVDERKLSATLLGAAVRRAGPGMLVAAYWIGDGALALFNPESADLQLLGDADSGEYSGQTRFLALSEFAGDTWDNIKKRYRCVWVPSGYRLVLMTDGVSDPKFGTEVRMRDAAVWSAWWASDLAPQVNLQADHTHAAEELERYLGFWSQGEHDDRTLAIVGINHVH